MKLLLSLLFLTPLSTLAVPLMVEQDFSYSDTDEFHANSDGWLFNPNAGGETLTQFQITTGSLQKSGIAVGTGNKLTALGNFESAGVLFASQPDIYASAMLRFDSVGRLDTNGTLLLYLGEWGVGSALGVHARLNDTKVEVGISKSSGENGVGVVWNNQSYDFGETIFLVLNYTTLDGSDNDIARAWIYGASEIDPAWGTSIASTPDLVVNEELSDRVVNQFTLHWNYSQPPTQTLPDYSLDAVRVGTNFESVTPVPEPSTYALILMSAVALIWFIKRRRSENL